MTAAVPDPHFREQLAEALPESLGPVSLRRPAPPALDLDAEVAGYGDMLLDALLPVVRRLAVDAEAAGFERGRRTFQFEPEGDNHHNARLCPYCSPDRYAAQPTDDGPT